MKLKDILSKKNSGVSKINATVTKIDKKQLEKLIGGAITEPIVDYKKFDAEAAGKGAGK